MKARNLGKGRRRAEQQGREKCEEIAHDCH
jgi:hypothetical protein